VYQKHTRFLLLKRNQKPGPESRQRLPRLMELNEPLYQAYLLEEDLRMFWSFETEEQGRNFLNSWIATAKDLNIKHFAKPSQQLWINTGKDFWPTSTISYPQPHWRA
jgi:transposase